MSPLIDEERATEAVGRDYVFFPKLSPAVLEKERWNPRAGAAGSAVGRALRISNAAEPDA
jgi:hypothetical protein